jgi:Right handed beta helix region
MAGIYLRPIMQSPDDGLAPRMWLPVIALALKIALKVALKIAKMPFENTVFSGRSMNTARGRNWQLVFWAALLASAPQMVVPALARTYYVDCGSLQTGPDATRAAPLRTLDQVNALKLGGDDQVLFKRGSVCSGSLRMQGSGSDGHPIVASAYGPGSLPRIEAKDQDEAAFRLFNQEYWEISGLEIRGGNEYGVSISGDAGTLHHLYLRDLRVRDVRGKLQRKESGLVVIRSSGTGVTLEDIELDGIQASDTTQWAGIFISGTRERPALHVRVRNSMVHDVQGDGIVLFNARDGLIARSTAWHTGMEHAESIGTPNAIWTWQCIDCMVEDNEAFLTDSPGVDGGAFDIDYGNTRNTVRNNFAHDTQGYCVAVFGSRGATTSSVLAGNLCLNNGMSPRLAQRQGAILLMTWEDGRIDGVEIRGNRIEWQPAGDTPAIQVGSDLDAKGVFLSDNHIWSNGPTFVNSMLKYRGEKNRYVVADADPEALSTAQRRFELLSETNSSLAGASARPEDEQSFETETKHARGWQLVASVPMSMLGSGGDPELRGVLVNLNSAALQFGHAGLRVTVASDGDMSDLAGVWLGDEAGLEFVHAADSNHHELSLKLRSPAGEVVQEWKGYVGPVALGWALRKACGRPAYGRLTFETVPATD